MKRHRLAIVRQKYRPDGGAERFVSRALMALGNQNLELNVITREWQGERQDDWHIHICNPAKWGRISRERGFANAARALWQEQQFDIVQSHERIAGCDIYRAGDGVHQRWLQQRSRILPNWRAKMLMHDRYHRYVMSAEREMYQSPELKAVICNAEMIKREIVEDFAVDAKKIHVIYNSIDSSRFIPAENAQRAALRQQYGLPASATVFCFVGSGFERKGLAAAIESIAGTPAYLIVIGQDKAEKRYQALAQSLGCKEQIRFMGMQKETLPFYQLSDGLLLPTLYDPFPNVILEAMACGLPVITSDSCGGAEFIEQGSNGFFCDALDIGRLREAVMAIPSLEKSNDMGMKARDKVKDSTPGKLSSQLISLYQNILD
ncbi:UDP-glucose:(heptosyl)LPS alpha-1,3-glucosyltransferase [Kosakonia arachidis]|uniref:UDP-glucose:(Heptosyl)LPS alpha-1,3-glucosyltransferase n=1 Tax=Kosakonia arachidis TaxID=551989 RepID=A0A1I7DIL5_9ENTR|nr:glycosyltransferase family 4 protein [Kosakonia arachidis]SFU11465.1 UDP-glucose:(heptosyl)LPS alpha-1,3-glucosyltransferase [Kosakonia arachidis]